MSSKQPLHMVALATAGITVVAALLLWRQQKSASSSSSSSSSAASEPKVHAHEAKDVKRDLAHLQIVGDRLRPTLAWQVTATLVDDATPVPARAKNGNLVKKVHLIRHGQGYHNVAQAEWRGAGKPGEPYLVSTDPEFRYRDAELTPKGEQQARDLRPRADALAPELMVVSPMRRATLTGLLAFEAHVKAGRLPVLAHESAHEIAGKHTCDQRLPVSELRRAYPAVDYSLVRDEEDPFWLDGLTRETHDHLAGRGAELLDFLRARPERHVVVAAHSMFLATLLNAVLVVRSDDGPDADAASWFGTGEMRTFLLEWKPAAAP